MYLLDTHSLIWWTLDPKKLSPRAAEACHHIEESANGYVSSITLWEIGIKIKNKKLDIGMSTREYLAKLKQMNLLQIIPVDEDIWLMNLELPWKHRDPVDRTLVATAKLKNISIVTIDDEIRKFYRKTIW